VKARIKIEPFSAMIPRLGDRVLPPNAAQFAANLRLLSGEIRGLHKLSPQHAFGTAYPKAYRLADPLGVDGYTWVGFSSRDVDLVKGPLIDDAYDRYYKFGDGVPQYNTLERIRNEDPWYYLGVPQPDDDPTVTPGSGTESDEERWYCYTFVSAYGEEGPPSNPVKGTGAPDATWAIANLDTTPADAANRNITHKNIYRTVPGYSSAEFFYVDQVTLATTSYNDDETSEDVARNVLLESTNFSPPPSTLEGVVLMANGYMVAWDGQNIYMSEPYRPHAWPAAYAISTEYPIVGAGAFAQSAVLATEGNPYTLTGVAPSAALLTKAGNIEPCLSRHTIVSYPNGVVFASQNGLVMVDSSGVNIFTSSLITKTEWVNEYTPANIWAAQHEDSYIAFYSATKGFIISPKEPTNAFVAVENIGNIDFIQTDPYTGDVFITNGTSVYLWDDPVQLPIEYIWRSKDFVLPKPCNIGAVQVCRQTDEESAFSVNVVFDEMVAFNTELLTQPMAALGYVGLAGATDLSWMLTDPPFGYEAAKAPLGGSNIFNAGEDLRQALVVMLYVYADGELVYSEEVHDGFCQRLPSGFKATVWTFEVRARKDIYSIKAAETAKGLMDV
jgi:hypothetical protein